MAQNRLLLRRMLEKYQYTSYELSDGLEAVSFFHNEPTEQITALLALDLSAEEELGRVSVAHLLTLGVSGEEAAKSYFGS